MTHTRRRFLKLAGAAAFVPAAPYIARAQGGYPNRPVHCDRRPGRRQLVRHHRAPDRPMAVGEARPAVRRRGAAGRRRQHRDRVRGARGARRLHAAPDERAEHHQRPLYEKLNFDFLRDIAPVAGIDRVPLVMEVKPSLPAKTIPEFIAYAKANPGQDQHGLGRHRRAAARRRRAVQVHGRRRHGACALPRLDAGGDRPDLAARCR